MQELFPGEEKTFTSTPQIFVPASKHYSLPKAVSLLGLGEENLINITLTEDTRQDIKNLTKRLDDCLDNKIPLITVVSVMGSTEESSVDPLEKILELRQDYRKKGLDFNIHADCAYGGYFKSLLVPAPKDEENSVPNTGFKYIANINDHTQKQFKKLNQVDTLTVDPHKSGYIPYACGAFLYRNGFLKNMLLFTGPYLGSQGPQIGTFGVEGSKAGAQAAAVYLSHQCIPLHQGGHGALLGQTLFNTKVFYTKLMTFESRTHEGGYKFRVTPLPRTSSERKGADEPSKDDLDMIKEAAALSINALAEKLASDEVYRGKFNEFGPDQNILSYCLNFFDVDKKDWNKDLAKMNAFTNAIYVLTSPTADKQNLPTEILSKRLLVSETQLDQDVYGDTFFNNFTKRAKVTDNNNTRNVKLLRSVLMGPWISETQGKSFFDIIVNEFDTICVYLMKNRHLWDVPSIHS